MNCDICGGGLRDTGENYAVCDGGGHSCGRNWCASCRAGDGGNWDTEENCPRCAAPFPGLENDTAELARVAAVREAA